MGRKKRKKLEVRDEGRLLEELGGGAMDSFPVLPDFPLENLSQKQQFLESLRVNGEIEIEISRLQFVRRGWRKVDEFLAGLTKQKIAEEDVSTLVESMSTLVKTVQLIEGRPTEIHRRELSDMSEEELLAMEKRLSEQITRYGESGEVVDAEPLLGEQKEKEIPG